MPQIGASVARAACTSTRTSPECTGRLNASAAGRPGVNELSTSRPHTWANETCPTSSSIPPPRERSEPPSLSGSAISDSKAITPSSPGLKSDIGVSSSWLSCDEGDRAPGRGTKGPRGSGRATSRFLYSISPVLLCDTHGRCEDRYPWKRLQFFTRREHAQYLLIAGRRVRAAYPKTSQTATMPRPDAGGDAPCASIARRRERLRFFAIREQPPSLPGRRPDRPSGRPAGH